MSPRDKSQRNDDKSNTPEDSGEKSFWFEGIVFIPDPTSGIYKPEPKASEDTPKQREQRSHHRVEIKRDPWAIGVPAILSFGTLVLLLFTVCFAKRQWEEMKKAADASTISAEMSYWATVQNEEFSSLTLGQMEGQTQAQEEAGKAATDSVQAAKDALRLDQRAWVGLAPSKIETNQGGVSVNRTSVINSGKSPAKKVEGLIGFYITTANYTPGTASEQWMRKIISRAKRGGFKNIDTVWTIEPTKAPPGFVGGISGGGRGRTLLDHSLAVPGAANSDFIPAPESFSLGALTPGIAFPIPRASWDIPTTSRFVIYGVIDYQDVFKTLRHTEFCVYTKPPSTEFSICPVFNDMQ